MFRKRQKVQGVRVSAKEPDAFGGDNHPLVVLVCPPPGVWRGNDPELGGMVQVQVVGLPQVCTVEAFRQVLLPVLAVDF